MAKTLRHRGYEGSVEVDLADRLLHGQVLFVNDLVTYEGDTVEALKRSFREAVDDYLALCEQRDLEPDRPFGGTFNVRVPPELHREAARAAQRLGISLNEVVRRALEAHLAGSPRSAKARRPPAREQPRGRGRARRGR